MYVVVMYELWREVDETLYELVETDDKLIHVIYMQHMYNLEIDDADVQNDETDELYMCYDEINMHYVIIENVLELEIDEDQIDVDDADEVYVSVEHLHVFVECNILHDADEIDILVEDETDDVLLLKLKLLENHMLIQQHSIEKHDSIEVADDVENVDELDDVYK